MAETGDAPAAKRQRVSTPEPLPQNGGRRPAGALVTGAASGIGLATAKLLASQGCRVLMADRDRERGEREATALGQPFAFVDVSEESSIKALLSQAAELLPELSYVVNVAGCDFYAPFEEHSAELFDRAIQVNLRSVFLVCREAVPMLKRCRGSIVNVASIQATRCFPNYSAYSATKGGIVSMSRQLAGDLAPSGVRVNSVSPGATTTNLGQNSILFEKQAPKQDRNIPPSLPADELLTMCTAEDVAQAIVAMLQLRGVTGQDLVVDGGCSIIGMPWWRPSQYVKTFDEAPPGTDALAT